MKRVIQNILGVNAMKIVTPALNAIKRKKEFIQQRKHQEKLQRKKDAKNNKM